jgi:hypothetical protein
MGRYRFALLLAVAILLLTVSASLAQQRRVVIEYFTNTG